MKLNNDTGTIRLESSVTDNLDGIKTRTYDNRQALLIKGSGFSSDYQDSIRIGSSKIRGFEVVTDRHRKNWSENPIGSDDDERSFEVGDKVVNLYSPTIRLPRRSDGRSAGYDFYTPVEFRIDPGEKVLVFTDIKAYMQPNEVLIIHPRSSSGTKHNLMLSNTTGIIDSSYYENESNDGNIGIGLRNIGDKTVLYRVGDRFAQGIFTQYLTTDDDSPISDVRTGGYGSSGR